MNEKELDILLNSTENQIYDVKSDSSFDGMEFRRDFTAFANTGIESYIIYGFEDKTHVKRGLSIDEVEKIKNHVNDVLKSSINPKIVPWPTFSEITFEGKLILVVEIHPPVNGIYGIERGKNSEQVYEFWIRRNGNKSQLDVQHLYNAIQDRKIKAFIDARREGDNISFDVYNDSDNSIILQFIGVLLDNGQEVDVQYYDSNGAPIVNAHCSRPNQTFSLQKFRNAFVNGTQFDGSDHRPSFVLKKHIEGIVQKMYIKLRPKDGKIEKIYSKLFPEPINMTKMKEEAKEKYEQFVKEFIHKKHHHDMLLVEHRRETGHFGGNTMPKEETEEEFKERFPFE